MGLLAPLYALAALAVIGPVIFHLIQRRPKRTEQFSSHMFLSPSRPTVTRRSRVDSWLLLLLRALAIILLALAFARPYFREESLARSTLEGRTVAIVIDSSASMRRAGVWDAAVAEAKGVLADLAANDRVALFTVDRTVRTIVPLEETDSDSRKLVRSALADIAPGWETTRLADGLIEVADQINSDSLGGASSTTQSTIVLLTDLHRNSGTDAMQGFDWPDRLNLEVRQVAAKEPGNAYLSTLKGDDSAVRIRISNTEDAATTLMQVDWVNETGQSIRGSSLQVPAGRSQVVSMGQQPAGATALQLSGDAFDADNRLQFAERVQLRRPILFAGVQDRPDEERLDYFLEKLPLDTPVQQRPLEVLSASSLTQRLAKDSLSDGNRSGISAVVIEVTDELPTLVDELASYSRRGGIVILCFASPWEANPLVTTAVGRILDESRLEIKEADKESDEFSLLEFVDYRSVVFEPMANPRFNDFSKLRFWRHREIALPEDSSIQTVAALDDGSPLLLKRQMATGQGAIWLLCSGWQPSESGLGVSSKFVPIILGMLSDPTRKSEEKLIYEVGQSIPVDNADDITRDGFQLPDELLERSDASIRIRQPGRYTWDRSGVKQDFVVVMPKSESLVTPQDPDVFDQFGVRREAIVSETELQEREQQLKIEQLEKKQCLWQWLLAAAVVALVAESTLGLVLRSAAAEP
ncbi:MAG TPA: hypothetical protein DDW52_20485 [Planctomycetaceae bacterium]|nr:hypothetical protein [Planctomycetaceae bacterium]